MRRRHLPIERACAAGCGRARRSARRRLRRRRKSRTSPRRRVTTRCGRSPRRRSAKTGDEHAGTNPSSDTRARADAPQHERPVEEPADDAPSQREQPTRKAARTPMEDATQLAADATSLTRARTAPPTSTQDAAEPARHAHRGGTSTADEGGDRRQRPQQSKATAEARHGARRRSARSGSVITSSACGGQAHDNRLSIVADAHEAHDATLDSARSASTPARSPIRRPARSSPRSIRPRPTSRTRSASTRATSTRARRTRRGAALEANLAAIEGGRAAFAFASGMAAIGAITARCSRPATTWSSPTTPTAARSGCSTRC